MTIEDLACSNNARDINFFLDGFTRLISTCTEGAFSTCCAASMEMVLVRATKEAAPFSNAVCLDMEQNAFRFVFASMNERELIQALRG